MRAQILLFDGFDELDAIAPWEVLRMAGEAGADLNLSLVCVGQKQRITAAHGLGGIVADAYHPTQAGELLIVPGGGWASRAAHGAWAEARRGEIPRVIAEAHRSGALIASVCTGAMLLAHAGLLQGRHATTHATALDDLRAMGAFVEAARVVDDGEIVSAGGITSGLDLSLYLIERLFGAELERKLERRLECERRGPIWQRGRVSP